MAKIVILGAGLTGISTAYHLEKNNFFDYQIFEKETEFGGLCRSIQQDGFTFDFTGHLLHINDEYFAQLIDEIVNKDNLNSIHRKSYVFSQNTFTHYPFQVNLFGLPTETIVECIHEFINKPKTKKDPKSFYNWAIYNFGAGFAKYFFIPFQNKIFDYDIKKISASWTGRFVPQTSLKQIIEGAIKEPNTASNIGYNSQFFYPKKNGIFYWVEKLAQKITNKIHTNFSVKSIDIKNKIIIFENGHIQKYEKIINTIPLDIMLNMITNEESTSFKKTAKKLICNSVVNFNLGIARKNLTDKHWIYFPETKFPFYRMGFPHNFSSNLVPKDCSSLYGEFSHINKTQEQINATLQLSISETKKLFNIDEKEIITQKIINIPRAYVIFDFWREKNLKNLLSQLENKEIFCVGRYGEWKYSSMQEAVLDGKKIAEKIINQKEKLIVPAKKINEFEITKKTPKEKELQ